MNNLKNKVSMIGRLGAKPEVTTFDSGSTIARFSLAVNEGYKDKAGKWVENTQWYTVNAWNKTAEIAQQILNKGQEIALEGKLENRTYENKKGETCYATSVKMSEFLILSPKNTKGDTAKVK